MLLRPDRGGDGPGGLGEAVPLSLRGGPGLEAVAASPRALLAPALDRRRSIRRRSGRAISRCRSAGASAPRRCAALDIALLDLRRPARGRRRSGGCSARTADPVVCNATLVAGDPAAAADGAAAGRPRASRPSSSRSAPADDVDAGRGGARRRSAPESRIRVDANGAWSVDEAAGAARDARAARDRARRAAGRRPSSRWSTCAGGSPIPIAADESVADLADAGGATRAGRLRPATAVKLAKVGGPDAALAIADAAARLPVERARRPGRDRRRGPRGRRRCERAAIDAGLAHGLAPPSGSSPTRSPTASALARPRRARCSPDGPGLGVEIDEAALRTTAARLIDATPTNRNTALASALRRGAGPLRRAPRGPLPRLALDPARRWRSGAQPAIEVTVIVDERCAGFFALGAAQATGVPAVVALHLRHRGGQPPPRRRARPTRRACR